MSQKCVYIIHGWGATPNSNWFPWVKEQLQERGVYPVRNSEGSQRKISNGVEVVIPHMPDTLTPDFNTWFSYIKKVVAKPDKNTYLVGHSLGVITILRFLESLGRGQHIGGAVLVSGFSELPSPVNHLPWLSGFVEKPVEYSKIKKVGGTIVVIHSDNDHLVPIESGKILRDKLGAELIIVSGAGHFLVKQSPIILKTILKIIPHPSKG